MHRMSMIAYNQQYNSLVAHHHLLPCMYKEEEGRTRC